MSLISRLSSLLTRQGTLEAHEADDFVAVGYPKTGNTWTRVMLGRYMQLAYGLPFLPLFDSGERVDLTKAGYRGPIGIFTHTPLVWEEQRASDLTYDNVIAPFLALKVLLIVRHPLDTLVSAYMHNTHQANTVPYQGTIVQFTEDPVLGLDKLLRFYQIWAANRHKARATLIWRYEDARARPAQILASTLEFLGVKAQPLLMESAVEFASFQNMQQLERSDQPPRYRSSGFPIFATGSKDNPNAYHVRKGRVGGYRDEFPDEFRKRLEARVSAEMPTCFGYSGG